MFNQTPSDPTRLEAREQGPNSLPYPWAQGAAGAPSVAVAREGYLTAAFVWMFLALLVSAAVATMTLANQGALHFVLDTWLFLLIAEVALVFGVTLAINRLSSTVAVMLLFIYAALNGATLSIIFLVYSVPSITSAFLGASAIFAAAAFYGAVTHRDLTSLGGLLFAGLIGIVVASFVNLLIGSGTFGYVIGIIGVLVFTGLTAWDVQRIQNGRLQWIRSRENASVVAALSLYLDFVNLFLMLLRVFGQQR